MLAHDLIRSSWSSLMVSNPKHDSSHNTRGSEAPWNSNKDSTGIQSLLTAHAGAVALGVSANRVRALVVHEQPAPLRTRRALPERSADWRARAVCSHTRGKCQRHYWRVRCRAHCGRGHHWRCCRVCCWSLQKPCLCSDQSSAQHRIFTLSVATVKSSSLQ